ncbi:fused MFS/spermidine synthase [Sphingomonas sp. HITSZ_GF]|uniref:fused MFS/spermidine synthase n=1 Tax=Sphingomonas sp. HITSZ_GF TaxID=3037247 RepID=UPI00240D1531|nr:fused MFS/spermidine synthase [Sphingomonas sp. HITSZ_GF]MDG2532854.1 fused MFS/spermidine synthase [Sphingomonas sp. HITSZ_GF]
MDEATDDELAAARAPRWLFVAAILAGSFLLFLVQPMVARMALPQLGGAPAVWNSAMLVYQALLLGGYAYAHWLGRVPPRMQATIHLAVLLGAALWLPIGVIAMELPAEAEPALWVPWLLVASIGPLFFAISAQAPLLQRWYSIASHGRDPYALYAASNIGSFGGLLAYPLIVEPNLALKGQSWLWTAGYVLVLLLVAGCASRLPRKADDEPHIAHHSPAPSLPRVLHWIVLALVPSGLMLATTTFLTTDIVAVPMLWVLPLGLYLLSFSVAFRDGAVLPEILTRFAPVIILLFGATLIAGHQKLAYLNAIIGLLLLFAIAVTLHTRMYALRPAPDRLTGFYLAMSVGGALGGVFAGLLAPLMFDWTYEYPLLVFAAGALCPQIFLVPASGALWRHSAGLKTLGLALAVAGLVWLGIANPGGLLGEMHEQIAFVLVAALGLVAIGRRPAFLAALAGGLILFGGYHAIQLSLTDARTRSYFGVYTVTDYAEERQLAHGTTLHGVQLKGALSREPTTYYVPGSGVGQAMQALPDLYGPVARVGVVGLGTGTLACYARPGQSWRFFEIDPAIVQLARDSGKFSFLSQCAPQTRISIGDARVRLTESPSASLDLLALDAFSSDTVPMHLLTRQAFATYGRVLAPNGLLLVHISNRFMALAPVVSAAAHDGGWQAVRLSYEPGPNFVATPGTGGGTRVEQIERDAESASEWIALSHDPAVLNRLVARGGGWRPLGAWPGFAPWTDDYASVIPVLRLLHPELADD